MNFYNYIYVISCFTITFIRLTDSSSNPELTVTKSGLELVSPCSIGLQFHADVNNTSENNDFDVELTPDQCCLELGSNIDCDVLEIVGGCVDVIRKGTTKKLKLIAPLLHPYERKGYCIAYLDSKLASKKHRIFRDSIRINFDTRVKNQEKLPENVKTCSKTDEDPMNDCYPVNCEEFYNGKKSFYSNKVKRCVEIPPCITDIGTEIPNVLYDPNKNECINDDSITTEDVNFIKTLIHSNDRTAKDLVIIKSTKPFSNETELNKEDISDKKIYTQNLHYEENPKPKQKCSFTKYLTANKFTLSVLGVVILIQCCLIFTMIYFLGKTCICPQKKKLIRKYYNYRQDASITTPLIGTSNMDTETTECQYLSESSNVGKKIKCYKACLKDKNNAKLSMSDDILSKCLNRRDWKKKSAKSDLMTEFAAKIKNDEKIFEDKEPDIIESKSKDAESAEYTHSKKISETRVNFEDENAKSSTEEKKSKIVKSIVKKKTVRTELKDSDIVLSEQEIKCHSYNYMVNSKETQCSSHHTSCHIYDPVSISQQHGYSNTEHPKSQQSLSTEKGAQASFSNDSIDDFLSERGMLFLPGENISKYSFSSNSAIKSSSSSVSSRTSKNYVMKNILSLLNKRSKHGPMSDPGVKKSKDSINLELIHMSHASINSSSNNNESTSEGLKSLKKVKDSRTSL